MEVMFILIGVSLLIALFFLGAFVWAVRSGQYEDCYTPSVTILFDDVKGEIKRSDDVESDVEKGAK